MPPEMMTSVIPSATQALMLHCRRMLRRLRWPRKPGATAAKATMISSKPISVPKSRMFKRTAGKLVGVFTAPSLMADMG